MSNVCSNNNQGDIVAFDCDPGAEGSLCPCLYLPECTFSSAGTREGREEVGSCSETYFFFFLKRFHLLLKNRKLHNKMESLVLLIHNNYIFIILTNNLFI